MRMETLQPLTTCDQHPQVFRAKQWNWQFGVWGSKIKYLLTDLYDILTDKIHNHLVYTRELYHLSLQKILEFLYSVILQLVGTLTDFIDFTAVSLS